MSVCVCGGGRGGTGGRQAEQWACSSGLAWVEPAKAATRAMRSSGDVAVARQMRPPAAPRSSPTRGDDEEGGDGRALEAQRGHGVDGPQEEAEGVEAGDEGAKVGGGDGHAA